MKRSAKKKAQRESQSSGAKPQGTNLATLSEIELKALACDCMETIQAAQQNLQMINAVRAQKANAPAPPKENNEPK